MLVNGFKGLQSYVLLPAACSLFTFHTSHFTIIITDRTQYTKADGLISDTILSIAKDLNGNIWFGTSSGVCRLNGTQFTSFTTKDGLTGNKINTISIDIDGSVWFDTDNGISHYLNNSWVNYIAQ